MKRAERLFAIYKLLKVKPRTIQQLLLHFKNNGVEVSERQLQRDVSALTELVNDKHEIMEVETQTNNKKIYSISVRH
jgi:predicted DNA-binding transcriptional regulator YafY